MSRFAIEESEHSITRYKKIHAAGCRDLRDPEEVGEAGSHEELLALLDGHGGPENMAELIADLAPCARKLLA